MPTLTIQVEIKLDEAAIKTLAELLAPSIQQAIEPPMSVEERKRVARLRASQNAPFAGQKLPEDQGLLITSRETAKLLKVSEKTLYNMHTTGQMPPPVRIGAAIRWSLNAIQEWVNAGCPAKKEQSADK